MTLNDPLANALSMINNNEKQGKDSCVIKPVSMLLKKVLTLLNKEGFVGVFKEIEDTKGNWLKLDLIGNVNNAGVIKPRFSVTKDNYEKFEKRFLPARNIGVMVVSTSQGIMTHHESKKKNIGGRLIAFCY
ncbi:MAG: 30S ribosomal protein S8 [Candidatus Woesearchaeota archaeon]|jgi:small subunit ribosomal protein S8|nr:30S ribosomal protein S8 [Candidatus Woesearchaeota archaeon]MDP7457954.1 30S ribosomal protein S8 [Candidatus Woesearchaeota archaeon]|tara:strand:+ start:15 stop:407 length:393 start_codon:yes stop_codon:yes gene_type:complete